MTYEVKEYLFPRVLIGSVYIDLFDLFCIQMVSNVVIACLILYISLFDLFTARSHS